MVRRWDAALLEHQEHGGNSKGQKQWWDDCWKLVQWGCGLMRGAAGSESIPGDRTKVSLGPGDHAREGMSDGCELELPSWPLVREAAPLPLNLGKTGNKTQESIPESTARGV